MGGPIKKDKAINIIKAVCTTYVTRAEIDKYFKENYSDVEEFEQEKVKEIGLELIKGKKRISPTFNEIIAKNGGRIR